MEALQMLKYAYRNGIAFVSPPSARRKASQIPSADFLAAMTDPNVQENVREDAMDTILLISAELGEDDYIEDGQFDEWIVT